MASTNRTIYGVFMVRGVKLFKMETFVKMGFSLSGNS